MLKAMGEGRVQGDGRGASAMLMVMGGVRMIKMLRGANHVQGDERGVRCVSHV